MILELGCKVTKFVRREHNDAPFYLLGVALLDHTDHGQVLVPDVENNIGRLVMLVDIAVVLEVLDEKVFPIIPVFENSFFAFVVPTVGRNC